MQSFKEYLLEKISSDLVFRDKSVSDLFLISDDENFSDEAVKEVKNISKNSLPSIRIEIYPHGKYLIVEDGVDYNIAEIFSLCLSKGIMIEEKFLLKNIKRNKKNVIRIEDNKDSKENDAILKLSYSKNRVSIFGEILPPKLNGCLISKEDIIENLKKERINLSFIISENVEKLFITQFYSQEKIMLAQGVTPVADQDACFINVLLESNENKKERSRIYAVKENQIILKKQEIIRGKNGIDLFNQKIPHKESSKTLNFPNIENTYNDRKKGVVLSKINGHMLFFDSGKIIIKPILVVPKDIIVHDNPIKTEGSVEVHGSVSSNKIEAAGNIHIFGTVENSKIIADGEIVVKEGVIDSKDQSTLLESSKGIDIKFAQKVNLKSSEEILFQEYLKNCTVYSFDKISSSRGEISGGKYVALNEIKAGFIGSIVNNINTVLHVGVNPILVEELDIIQKESVFLKKKIETEKHRLETTKKEELKDKIKEFQEKLDECLNQVVELKKNILKDESFGRIKVENQVYKGVLLNCANKNLLVKNDMEKVIFRNTPTHKHVVVEKNKD